MAEQVSYRTFGPKLILALTALFFITALIGGGSDAYGSQRPESNDPPRPGLLQLPQAYAANFCLSSFQTKTDGLIGGDSGPIPFSLQQQPFVEGPVRLRDDDPEHNKKSSVLAVGFRVISTNVLTWAVEAIYYLYGLHIYIGPAGNKVISIFKPRIAVKLFGNLSLGFEYLLYAKNSQLRDFPDVHASNSEQKLCLMLYY